MANINKLTSELGKAYPIEYNYNSRCTLWQLGLSAELVTQEQFDQAQAYYGRLWNYVGD